MGPEAAAGAREARGRLCQRPGDDPRRPPPPRGPESSTPAPWRPWMLPPRDAELTRIRSLCEPWGNQHILGSKRAFGFQHPVRLYLPISKRQEYLQSSGEKVLASFPVQATIHFYNDESESDSEEEQEEAQPNRLQCQEVGQQPRRKWQSRAGEPPGRKEQPRGKGQLPIGDSAGIVNAPAK